MNMNGYNLVKRTEFNEISIYYDILNSHEEIVSIIDSMPLWVLLLNENRQAVYFNQKLSSDINAKSPQDIIGKRPGEILQCQNSALNEAGCGNSVFCQYCGAVTAIVNSYNGGTQIEECRIIRSAEGLKQALDLEVTVSTINLKDHEYTLFIIQDISDKKRRHYLERIFLHDLVNTAYAIKSSADLMLTENDVLVKEEMVRILIPAANQLLEEISAQRQILQAEQDEWEPVKKEYFSTILMKDCVDIATNYMNKNKANIIIDTDSESFKINTEITLLKRVLINMLKNAIEATDDMDSIRISSRIIDEGIVQFSVNNKSYISDDIRYQLFQRSYTTKGKGRGIGTYSMKLLTEHYLGGKITVESSIEKGTTFFVTIPVNLKISS